MGPHPAAAAARFERPPRDIRGATVPYFPLLKRAARRRRRRVGRLPRRLPDDLHDDGGRDGITMGAAAALRDGPRPRPPALALR